LTAPAASGQTLVERLARRDRWIVAAGLALICLLAWCYVLAGSGTGMSVASMTTWQFPPPVPAATHAPAWGLAQWIVVLLMWWIMMIAMMVPSAAPMILLFARVYRHAPGRDRAYSSIAPTAAFAAGYLLAWLGFSALAAALHWGLERSGLVDHMSMWSTVDALSGSFLLVAGAWQLSPFKNACLRQCRSPAAFLSAHWRKSRLGAARMGALHGLYCVGCCWSLMLLLFVGGVMNVLWIAALAILVLLEKLHRYGRWIARGGGVLMVAAGAYLLLNGATAAA
jgi:predicted metal-binding membrane protein